MAELFPLDLSFGGGDYDKLLVEFLELENNFKCFSWNSLTFLEERGMDCSLSRGLRVW